MPTDACEYIIPSQVWRFIRKKPYCRNNKQRYLSNCLTFAETFYWSYFFFNYFLHINFDQYTYMYITLENFTN